MDRVSFSVNGLKYSVGPEINAETSLNAYLRYHLNLRGTKAMCHEGGCGACVVSARLKHPVSGDWNTIAINSCLVLVFSCNGWEITTVEGIGNRKDGYHPIQTRLKDFSGTQCGYCSPGWVMSMYSLLDKHLTMVELEKSFGSNTCRCTGYRPILDTMKSFATDASQDLHQRVKDIEDLDRTSCNKSANNIFNMCKKTGQECQKICNDYDLDNDWCVIGMEDNLNIGSKRIIQIETMNHKFFIVSTVDDIFYIWNKYGDCYMLIAGDTAKGVYEDFTYPKNLINIQNVEELKCHEIDQNLIAGANMTLEDARTLFEKTSQSEIGFSYLAQFVKHMDLVAHLPVKNLGTLAGNLMIKHKMPSFQSDIFVLLETVGSVLTIKGPSNYKVTVSLPSFLQMDMTKKIIYDIRLPPLGASYNIKTYKIMPRHQNAHAIVNAGFLVKLDRQNKVLKANIVYGAITSKFIHATKTEQYLKGKYLFSNETLQAALSCLSQELIPDYIPQEPSPESRKKLALGLFYKFIVNICPPGIINTRLRSGGNLLERPLSHGSQDYQTDSEIFPLNEPVSKLEGLIQCSGEAQYVNDVPSIPHEVYGAFVLSTIHSGSVDTIDSTEILKINGVLAVYTAKDIRGKNSFSRVGLQLQTEEEEILASDNIKYFGQPIAICVANSENLAAKVAKLIKVTYKNISSKPPVLTIAEARKDSNRVKTNDAIKPTGKGTDVKKVLKGSFSIHAQYHYTLEPQTCLVVPVDKALEVYSSNQWMNLTQIVIADSLNTSENNVQMMVRRIGGGYGVKISRSAQTATACALVAKLMNVPCRFILPIQTNMASIGCRLPFLADYEVGVNDDGKVQYLELSFYEDNGCSFNESVISFTLGAIKNCYDGDYWHVMSNDIITDLPSNTFFRAPGSCEGIAMAEQLMEHIAFGVQKDSTEVRVTNMRNDDNDLPQLLEQFKRDCDYENRLNAAKRFNQANRWIKKYLKIATMSFPAIYYGNYSAMVTIYQGDGTVTVSTGGIEMGQGINTKAAQVCAYSLGIPLECVAIVPNYTFIAANNVFSGSSITSESVCYSIIKACGILKSRLEPIKKAMKNPTWKELIAKASEEQVDLMASIMMTDKESDLKGYSVFGITILEVELDCLTGQFEILRVDLLEDVGLSMSPKVDIGQVEGAFVQGLGYWTSEKPKYDLKTGKLLTNRSWNYKVPLALDIPADFRIKLRYNSRNSTGVLGSKAVGECPLCMSVVIIHALRECIMASRKESGYDSTQWLDISTPFDLESILLAIDARIEEFVLTV